MKEKMSARGGSAPGGKKVLLILLSFIFITSFFSNKALADNDSHTESIETVLNRIMSAQNINEINKIDCGQITDEQFEQLGDSYMEQIHPGKQHALMDQMMGGEGPSSLKTIHIRMGQAYLGCGNNFPATGVMGMGMMSGFGMMGSGMTDNSFLTTNGMGENFSMMGLPFMGGGLGVGFNWIIIILFWGLVILGIVWLIKFLKGKDGAQANGMQAMDILKNRYAKGEITKEKFKQMKKDLN